MDVIVADEQALARVSKALRTYTIDLRKSVDDAIHRLEATNSEWTDDDYQTLREAFDVLLEEVDGVEVGAVQLIERAEAKINEIRQLHNIQI